MKSVNHQAYRYLLKAVLVTVLCFWPSTYWSLQAQGNEYYQVVQFGPDRTGGIFYSLAYSPDSQWIAVGTYDPHAIEIRGALTGQIVTRLIDKTEQAKAPIAVPSWSPNGQYIAEISIEYGVTPHRNTGTVYVWEVQNGHRTVLINRTAPTSQYADALGHIGSQYVSWRPNTTQLLITDNDLTIRLLDFPSGKVRWIISPYSQQAPEFALQDLDYPCQPHWNPDGSQFECIGYGIHAIFDGATGQHLFDLQDEVSIISHSAWTRDGNYIVNEELNQGDNTFLIKIWNASNGQQAPLPVKTGFPFSVSPDSKWIAYVDIATNNVVIAAFKTNEVLGRIDIDYNPNDREPTWSPDGLYLALIDRSSTAHIFALQSGTF